ncbi:hemicentin-2-like [Sarcoptes scabiei]|nr:hemicentin-2-like [Sarcoptes scabiei]
MLICRKPTANQNPSEINRIKMGMFDFLYKTPNRSKHHSNSNPYRKRPNRFDRHNDSFPNQNTSNHYKKRTETKHLGDIPNESLPFDDGDDGDDGGIVTKRKSFSNLNQISSNQLRSNSGLDVIDYYNRSKQDNNDDDFTRLSRLEAKIDNYRTRFDEISDELVSIKSNMYLILKEFSDEFQNDIINTKNRHIVEIGKRILVKLDSFELDQQEKQSSNTIVSDEERKFLDEKKFVIQNCDNKSNELFTLAQAQYALVDHFDFDQNDPKYLQSTPNLSKFQNNFHESIPNNLDSIQSIFVSDSPIFNGIGSKISSKNFDESQSLIHSDNPGIEYCLRRIESLHQRINCHRSVHKLKIYKELKNELDFLEKKLNSIDCSKDALYQQEKNLCIEKIFNLKNILERSIDCRNNECVICNSLIYRPEIAV